MRIFRPRQDRSHRFVPRSERLEGRIAPVRCVPIGNGVFCFPEGPPTPPRTGGAAFLSGSTLIVVTNHPGSNQGAIQDDGAGNVTVEWNGHAPPTFHGVTQIILDGKGRRNTFNINLTGNVTVPHDVTVVQHGHHNTLNKDLGNFNTNGLTIETLKEPPSTNLAKGF
jgi:hypothetical protein